MLDLERGAEAAWSNARQLWVPCLSFMAAETLSRRAFPHHPQLWRAWAKEPGASIQILGRTVSGYLLVSVFFAYDVLLYVITTRTFGWRSSGTSWSCSVTSRP